MKTVYWSKFSDEPRRHLGEKKIRVRFKNGGYFTAQYYSPIVEEEARRPRGKKLIHECYICGKLEKVVFVIPFDGSFPPGCYCVKCKHKYDIMDVAVAKHYHKIPGA